MLVLALLFLIQADPPPFGLDNAAAEPSRCGSWGRCSPCGCWLLALPLFLRCPDRPTVRIGGGDAVRAGLRDLRRMLRGLRHEPVLLRFLVARLVYNDGLNTLFAFGGIYAAGTFGMTLDEVIQLGIALNLTAGLGAFLLAQLDDRLGSKPVILLALAGLIVAGTVALLAQEKRAVLDGGAGAGLLRRPGAVAPALMARLAP